MTNEHTTTVDFVARGKSDQEWKIVLVEEGPWAGSIEQQLKRVQGRLYDCIDAAIDGELARKFPEANGKRIVVQLDCYNVPRIEVEEFFRNFTSGVFADDYRQALEHSTFVRGVDFEINFDNVH